MEKPDIIIVGAGIIGLSIAAALSQKDKSIIVIEKEKSFGRGSSSRNSEVIHSGIYYNKGSLKARFCVEGRELLYRFCGEHGIPHKKTGKLIVASDRKEEKKLKELLSAGKANNVSGLRLLSKSEVRKIEPEINAFSALYSPGTGIVDTHLLMKRLESIARNRGVIFAYGCRVTAIDRKRDSYEISVSDIDNENLTLSSRMLINCAGLFSDMIAEMAGINTIKSNYKLRYSKGEYFRVSNKNSSGLKHLIYPVPGQASLGIHTVVDMAGGLKLGPNAYYIDEIDYDVNPSNARDFYESAKKYLPFLEIDDLSPDMAGVRAKLQKPDEPERDFVVSDEKDKGLPGFINLIGIESPGLTASLAIAKYIESMV